jgi:hypothetical protein
LSDKAGIDRCVELPILGRDVRKSCVLVTARMSPRRCGNSLCAIGL